MMLGALRVGVGLTMLCLLFACTQTSSPPNDQPDISVPSVSNKLQYQSEVGGDRSEALNEAISSLYAVNLDQNSNNAAALTAMMKISDAKPSTLQDWLEVRAHYIVNDNFEPGQHTRTTNQPIQYPFPNDIPDVIAVDLPPKGALPPQQPVLHVLETSDDQSTDQSSSLMMLNTGTQLYFYGKQAKVPLFLDLSGIGNVAVTSPRIGLVEIGPGLFSFFQNYNVQNILKDIFRVSILFHEARHSDGHGKSLGFMHAKCPAELAEYAGMNVCDGATNGAYTIGALLLKNMAISCGDACTAKTKNVLRAVFYDTASRVLNRYQLPNTSAETKAGTDWDDAPESLPQ
jgi:hypothetical protein